MFHFDSRHSESCKFHINRSHRNRKNILLRSTLHQHKENIYTKYTCSFTYMMQWRKLKHKTTSDYDLWLHILRKPQNKIRQIRIFVTRIVFGCEVRFMFKDSNTQFETLQFTTNTIISTYSHYIQIVYTNYNPSRNFTFLHCTILQGIANRIHFVDIQFLF